MGALAVHHTATENSAWDGPAAVAAMPNDAAVLAYCHAWRDGSAASDAKDDYKFPHHRTKGGPANIPACRNGLARLEGSTIPDGDKAGVKAHLQAHLDDAKEKDTMAPNALAQYGLMTTQQRVQARVPRAKSLSQKDQWFRLKDSTEGAARLDVFDEIGFWGISASELNAQLQALSSSSIEVHINSPGGDVFDGIAILNMLRGHPATINVIVDGLAASAASFIAMAGNTITMMPNSQMMIHDASGICMGNHADMTAMAELLDKCSDNIASIYAGRAGGTVTDWRTLMRAETWLSAEETVDVGLADMVASTGGVNDAERTAFLNLWNMSLYVYDSRAASPAPVRLDSRPPDPAEPVFNPELFRAAMRDALSTDRKAAP